MRRILMAVLLCGAFVAPAQAKPKQEKREVAQSTVGNGFVVGDASSTNNEVGVTVILRQLVKDKKIQKLTELKDLLTILLEGNSGKAYSAKLSKFRCERSAGSDDCSLEVIQVDAGGTGLGAYTIEFNVYQGNISVTAAHPNAG